MEVGGKKLDKAEDAKDRLCPVTVLFGEFVALQEKLAAVGSDRAKLQSTQQSPVHISMVVINCPKDAHRDGNEAGDV